MNIATLNKVQLFSSNYNDFIEEAKTALARTRFPGQLVSSFYLSHTNSQEVYLLSFWQSLVAAQSIHEKITPEMSDKILSRVNSYERQFFKLIWDYRLLSTIPKASLLRLITFPDHFSEEQIKAVTDLQRQRRDQVPGVVGIWIGQSLHNPKILLNQIDWVSIEAQQNFFEQPGIQEAVSRWQNQGIILEYASFNLKDILLFEHL